jgi:hypothetical protein
MPVKLDIEEDAIHFEVTLTPAVVSYKDLLAAHGGDLAHELTVLAMDVSADGVLRGAVPRETGLPENLVTVENRLPLAERVRELRRFAPAELNTRIDRARSTRDIDAILIELAQHFPDSPEMEEAIERAAEREHAHPDRVRERAQGWLTRRPARA